MNSVETRFMAGRHLMTRLDASDAGIWESALRERQCRRVQRRGACPAPDIPTKRLILL